MERSKTRDIRSTDVAARVVCGGVAGMIAKTVTAPLERIKMLSQTGESSTKPGRGGGESVVGIIKNVLKTEGVAGFWAGNGANLIRIFPSKGVVFTSNDVYKQELLKLEALHVFGGDGEMKKKASPVVSFMAGGLSGMTATAATYPLDLVRGRIGGKSVDASGNKKYSGVMNVLKITVKEEGFLALYRGVTPTVVGAVPYVGIQFGTVGLLETLFPKDDTDKSNNVLRKILFGAAGGVAAGVITYPNDTVRRMMQLQGTSGTTAVFTGYWDCVTKVYAKHGIGRFYNGAFVNIVRMAPNTAVQFGAYELLKDLTSKVL
jgi:hypothetical protein